jgi:hypothetical protein
LSSPQLKRYGCLDDTSKPLTGEMWPVSDSFSSPEAKSHIFWGSP